MASPKESALRLLREPLAQVGFRKRPGGIFTTDLSDGVLGWVGLNSASHGRPAGEVLFNPVVGVRHEAVQGIYDELLERRALLTPTVSSPLRYLMAPEARRDWCFSEAGSDSAEQLADLVACIDTYGLPFMEALTTLPAVEEALKAGLGHGTEYKLPIVVALTGDRERALNLLDGGERERDGKTYPEADQFRRFAARFRLRSW